jgi:hypothetical protein
MALYLGVANNGRFITLDGYTLQDSNSLSLSALPAVSKFKIMLNGVAYHVNIELPAKESE